MISQTSRANFPYRIHPFKNSQLQNLDNNSQMMSSYYSPKQEYLDDSTLTMKIKMRGTPLSANKQRRIISNNNQSMDRGRQQLPFKFPSESNISNQILSSSIYNKLKSTKYSDKKSLSNQQKSLVYQNKTNVTENKLYLTENNDENKSTENESKLLQGNNNIKKFILKKMDQSHISYNRQNPNSLHYKVKNLFSQNSDEYETSLDRGMVNGSERNSKFNFIKILDNSKTTDNTDDTENSTSIQILKNSDEIDQQQYSLQYLSQKSINDIQEEDDFSENDSEEDYNIWSNNDEVLMRGIDFENFTDRNSKQFYPQVLFKVRSVFYNQFNQRNNSASSNNTITNNYMDTNKKSKIVKSNANYELSYKDMLDNIPTDKKIQQDYSILKETFETKNQKTNHQQQLSSSPQKIKNHFIIELERERFFQNIQIHSRIKNTPQFISFEKYFTQYKKDELNKQKPAKYSRYPTQQSNISRCQSQIRRRRIGSQSIQEQISIQGSPRNYKRNISISRQSKPKLSYNNYENQILSPLIPNEKQYLDINKKRCSSIFGRKNNKSVNLEKSVNQINLIQQDMYNPRTKIIKKSLNNIFEENMQLNN